MAVQVSRKGAQQRTAQSSRFSMLVHIIGLCSFASCFKYLVDYPNFINESYGWHFQYLTIIGLTLSSITFVIGLATDVVGTDWLFSLKNDFSVISTPLELLISTLYWTLRSIDRDLVMPKDFELDPTADIGFHVVPTFVLIIDFLYLSPPWRTNAASAFCISFGLALIYWAWIERCFQINHWYPYPIFGMLSMKMRAALFAVSAGAMTLNTAILKYAHQKVNKRGPKLD